MSAAEYAARLTMCRCGHQAIEHYDSYLFCTWTVEDKCDCEEFVAAGPEIHVQVGGALPSGEKQPHE